MDADVDDGSDPPEPHIPLIQLRLRHPFPT